MELSHVDSIVWRGLGKAVVRYIDYGELHR